MERKSSKGGSKHTILQFVTIPFLFVIFSITLLGNQSTISAYSKDDPKYNVSILKYGIHNDVLQEGFSYKIVPIKRGKYVYWALTNKTDIQQVLNDNNIVLDKKEKIVCNTNFITDGTVINILRTETLTEYKNVTVPFKTETIKTDKYAKGEEHIIQQGRNGLRTQKIISYYEDGILVRKTLVEDKIKSNPVTHIVEIGTAEYSLNNMEQKGYNCNYWYSVVDSGPYTQTEKEWLKFVMYCESGCNAESNKGYYKGLFQWSPSVWSKLYTENIFDGHAQIKHTIEKYRAGGANMWPACNKRFSN